MPLPQSANCAAITPFRRAGSLLLRPCLACLSGHRALLPEIHIRLGVLGGGMDKSSLPSFKCQFLTQAFSDRLPKAVPSHLLLFPDGTASFYLDRCYRAKYFPSLCCPLSSTSTRPCAPHGHRSGSSFHCNAHTG